MDSADDLRIAFELSDRAASLALDHFEAGVVATVKADGTPSTTADPAQARLNALGDASRARLLPGDDRAPVSPLPLVELVRGEIDGLLAEGYHPWDHAPWILLVEEAGGRFTDRAGGHASDQGGGLYSNAALHRRLLAALDYPVPGDVALSCRSGLRPDAT